MLAATYWTERRNNHTNLLSLLIANTITGAASLFRRELVDGRCRSREFPRTQYHDHWLALVALSMGDIAYVDRPLYDYVQHGVRRSATPRPMPASKVGAGFASGSASATGAAGSPPRMPPTSAATSASSCWPGRCSSALRRGVPAASAPP